MVLILSSVLSSWNVQSRREDLPQFPDFVTLNRDAVRSGLITSKELNQYRLQVGGTTAQNRASGRRRGGASRPPPVPPDVTFGVTNR